MQFCAAKGITFSRVPGLEIKKSMGMQRGKNDKKDAGRIALYGYEKREKLQIQNPCSSSVERLKLLLTQRAGFVNERTAVNQRMKHIIAMMVLKSSDPIIKNYQKHVASLNKRVAEAEVQIQQLITGNDDLHQNFELITTVPGIGKVNAWMLLACTENFTRFSNGRKFGSYCGIVPFEHMSGTSIRGKSRVSHMANKQIKASLTLSARAAVNHDPELKAYYERRKLLGKHHMSILNEVKFKLVLRVFAVVNRATAYINRELLAA